MTVFKTTIYTTTNHINGAIYLKYSVWVVLFFLLETKFRYVRYVRYVVFRYLRYLT